MTSFLIRFDDFNEEMNWKIWDQIELFLDNHRIRPLVAVIPKNADKSVGQWEKNLGYQTRYLDMHEKGYEICQHGYEHLYVTNNPGIFGLSPRSEFAGVDPAIQRRKIKAGKEILQNIGITPRCWIGPNHSYDQNTMIILKDLGFSIVSDGLHQFPYNDSNNLLIVPCQLWKMKSIIPGAYTVCYHHNEWDQGMLERFKLDVVRNLEKITYIDDYYQKYRKRNKSPVDTFLPVMRKAVTHGLKVKAAAFVRKIQ